MIPSQKRVAADSSSFVERKLYDIAEEIKRDWKRPSGHTSTPCCACRPLTITMDAKAHGLQ